MVYCKTSYVHLEQTNISKVLWGLLWLANSWGLFPSLHFAHHTKMMDGKQLGSTSWVLCIMAQTQDCTSSLFVFCLCFKLFKAVVYVDVSLQMLHNLPFWNRSQTRPNHTSSWKNKSQQFMCCGLKKKKKKGRTERSSFLQQ